MERRWSTREFKLEAVRLIKDRGVSYAQASQDLKVHPTQLRNWVKPLADDPRHAFPDQGQMKPEELEIARLKHEMAKLKAERDILKKAAVDSTDGCKDRTDGCVARHQAAGGSDSGSSCDRRQRGLALAHLQHVTQISDSLALGGGSYHFFVRRSFSAAWSSINSANQILQFAVLVFQ